MKWSPIQPTHKHYCGFFLKKKNMRRQRMNKEEFAYSDESKATIWKELTPQCDCSMSREDDLSNGAVYRFPDWENYYGPSPSLWPCFLSFPTHNPRWGCAFLLFLLEALYSLASLAFCILVGAPCSLRFSSPPAVWLRLADGGVANRSECWQSDRYRDTYLAWPWYPFCAST